MLLRQPRKSVMPAHAGIQKASRSPGSRLRGNDGVDQRRGQVDGPWIPACAGMTALRKLAARDRSLDSRLRGNDDGVAVQSILDSCR